MKHISEWIVKLGTLLLVLVLAFGAGGVYAQTLGDLADSDSGQNPPGVSGSTGSEEESVSSFSQAEDTQPLAASDTNSQPAESDGFQSAGPASPENQVSPSALTSPVLSYYFVPGTEFKGKSSNFGYTYVTKGCFFRSTTLGAEQYTAPIHIPNGSVLKGMRIYFIDNSTTGGVGGWLTSYNPGVTSKDLISVNNGSISIGSGFVDSNEITQTVTTDTTAYTLIVYTGTADSTVQVCGVRLAYYAPAAGAAFLPVVMSK